MRKSWTDGRLEERFDRLERRIDERLARVDERFDQVKTRFNGLDDQRFSDRLAIIKMEAFAIAVLAVGFFVLLATTH
jgi:hypothetical protein